MFLFLLPPVTNLYFISSCIYDKNILPCILEIVKAEQVKLERGLWNTVTFTIWYELLLCNFHRYWYKLKHLEGPS